MPTTVKSAKSALDAPLSTGRSTQFMCQWRAGFTLFEMMVVITIIAILASISSIALTSAKEKARQTDCMSNLRQLGTAIVTYRADNRGRNPDWLSALYPTYIDDKRVFVCRSDKAKGMGAVRPDNTSLYKEAIDNISVSRHKDQNNDVDAVSYLYEFNAAACSWGQSERYVTLMYGSEGGRSRSWAEIKEAQLAFGNKDDEPYSSSLLPIVRCFHHLNHGRISADRGGGNIQRDSITINVAYAGNVVIAPLKWEEYVEPGRSNRNP